MAGQHGDTERIKAYGLLRVARGDATPLPGFQQDDYVRGGIFQSRTLASLIEEFRLARALTLALPQKWTQQRIILRLEALLNVLLARKPLAASLAVLLVHLCKGGG